MTARHSQHIGRLRLRHLNEIAEAKDEEMCDAAPRFQALSKESAKKPIFSSFNLFPTPPCIARQMVELADIRSGHKVLEPSAGTGNLLQAIRECCGDPYARHIEVTAVEIDGPLWHHLSDSEFAIFTSARLADFLTWEAPHQFDRIVMNPPFKNGVDRKHITRAASMLAPGGRLVALCANGPRQRRDLQSIADQWIELPSGSFRSEGTGVDVAMILVTR